MLYWLWKKWTCSRRQKSDSGRTALANQKSRKFLDVVFYRVPKHSGKCLKIQITNQKRPFWTFFCFNDNKQTNKQTIKHLLYKLLEIYYLRRVKALKLFSLFLLAKEKNFKKMKITKTGKNSIQKNSHVGKNFVS